MPEKGHVAGVKRKRSNASREEEQTVKLAGKLHHHVREVRKVAKKAKTFELQKTVKKLKGLRSKAPDSAEIPDLEAQLELLKKCDPEPFANTALRTKIHKDKLLSADEHIAAAITQELSSNLVVPAAPGSNEAKVQGRLLSSKIIATEVASVVEALKEVISPELKKAKGRAQGEDEEYGNEGDDEEEVHQGIHPVPTNKKAKLRTTSEGDQSDQESVVSSRVQAFSDEQVDDAGWESGSIHGSSSAESDGSDDEDPFSEASGDEQSPRPSASSGPDPKTLSSNKASKSQLDKPKKAGESTFLPSLAVGFTRGDSDASDFSDDDADVAPKKNRRGQRARRAIWEKKYGRNANHVKKQQEISGKGKPRDKANKSAPQRFVKGQSDKGWPRHQQQPQQSSAGPAQGSQPLPPQMRKGQKEEKPLHPSWAAKKMLKEKQNPSIVAPQGKKIVF